MFFVLSFSLLLVFITTEVIFLYRDLNVHYTDKIKRLENANAKMNNVITKNQLELGILVNAIMLPIVYINEKRQFRYMNDSFKELFKEHLMERPNDFYGIPELQELVTRAYLDEKPSSNEVMCNGVFYNIISDPLFVDGCYDGMVVVFGDISHYKSMEQLHKNFIQDVSHELKTPIAAIKGATEILITNPSMDSEVKDEFLHIVKSENERLESLVFDLIDITRIESDTFVLNKTLVDPVLLCEGIIRRFEVQRMGKNIELIFRHEGPKACQYLLDSKRLQQVFINLIANALHYTDAGQVILTCKTMDEGVEFIVHDTGMGISEEDQKHVFDRFYRVDQARARNSGGSGLGLSIIKSIVNAHEGQISLQSVLGEFTEFRITFDTRCSCNDIVLGMSSEGMLKL